MAGSDYTYGCGKFLPGYGPGADSSEFVPWVGIPVSDPPIGGPGFVCVPYIAEQAEPVQTNPMDGFTTYTWSVSLLCVEVGSQEYSDGIVIAGVAASNFASIHKAGYPTTFENLDSFGKTCYLGDCLTVGITVHVPDPLPTVTVQPSKVTPDPLYFGQPVEFDYTLDIPSVADTVYVLYVLDESIPLVKLDVVGAETVVSHTQTFADPGSYTVSAAAWLGSIPLDVGVKTLDFEILEPEPSVSITITPAGTLQTGLYSEFSFLISEPGVIDELVIDYGNGDISTPALVGLEIFDGITYVDAGDYLITATGYFRNEAVATTSLPITITQNPYSLDIIADPEGLSYEIDTSVLFTPVLTGDPGGTVMFFWSVDGGDLQLSPTLGITFTEEKTYTIKCIASTGTTAIAEKEITVTVTIA